MTFQVKDGTDAHRSYLSIDCSKGSVKKEGDGVNTSVQQFKVFMEQHPLLLQEVRQGKRTMQETYEQFILLGADDPSWHKYHAATKNKEKETNQEEAGHLTKKIWKHIEKLDMNQLESHINDLNGAIENVVVLIDQFKQFRSKQSDSMHRQSKD